MTTEIRHRLVDQYMARLDKALRDLPSSRRREVVDDVSAHASAALAEMASPTEADVRQVLDRLGDPEDIATEARERFGIPDPQTSSWLDSAAIVLVLLGGFLAGIGWLVGVALLWRSLVWRTWEKALATLLVPGGLATGIFVVLAMPASTTLCSASNFQAPQCSTTGGTPLWVALTLTVVLIGGPIASAVVLSRRLRAVR